MLAISRRVARETTPDLADIEAESLTEDAVCSNPDDRCYHCKRFIFSTVLEAMAGDGRDILLDGTNASDDPARRPGFRALAELGVVSPLREAGVTQDRVRTEERRVGEEGRTRGSPDH